MRNQLLGDIETRLHVRRAQDNSDLRLASVYGWSLSDEKGADEEEF